MFLLLGCCFGLFGLFFFGPEAMPGAANENVFESRLTNRDRVDLAGECFDYFWNELVAVFEFEANFAIERCGGDAVFLANALRKSVGIRSFEENDVAADLLLERC